jgi:hypothetical protein
LGEKELLVLMLQIDKAQACGDLNGYEETFLLGILGNLNQFGTRTRISYRQQAMLNKILSEHDIYRDSHRLP